MSIQFSNNAATKLVADLAVDALTAEIALEDVAKFPVLTKPEDYFVATITSSVPSGKIEVVKVTSLDTNTGIATIVRAHEGIGANAPVAFEFAIGDRFEHRWTAGSIYEVIKMGEAGGDVDTTSFVTLADAQTISGAKTFSGVTTFEGNVVGPESETLFKEVTTGKVTVTSEIDATVNPDAVIKGNVVGNLTGNVTGDVTGNLVGNADTATLAATATLADSADKLTTPRKITLTGGATGEGTFDGSGDLAIATTVEAGSGVEVGTIVVWPGGALPEGYLLCNGGTVKKADYPALYAVIGDKYNGGGGSSI